MVGVVMVVVLGGWGGDGGVECLLLLVEVMVLMGWVCDGSGDGVGVVLVVVVIITIIIIIFQSQKIRDQHTTKASG